MTIKDEITELVNNKLSEVDDILRDIISDVKSGGYSNVEITEQLEELRKKVW